VFVLSSHSGEMFAHMVLGMFMLSCWRFLLLTGYVCKSMKVTAVDGFLEYDSREEL